MGQPGSGGVNGEGTGGATASGGTSGDVGFINPAPGSTSFVGANMWNASWEPGNVFAADVDFATTTNPWLPELLTDLAPYSALRLMDWNATNADDTPQAHFATRPPKTGPQGDVVAYEWQFDLCNRTKKDLWLNVHHRATADDWRQLAAFVRDNLDANLRVYLEWSNEVWNASFPVHAFAEAGTTTLALNVFDSIPASSYYVYQSVRLFEAFDEVFGADKGRLVHVLSGQNAWAGPCGSHMKALADKTINPKGTKPDFYAVAPYVTGTSVADLNAHIDETVSGYSANSACAAASGITVITYEGGPDSFALGGPACTTIQHDAGMKDFYLGFLQKLTAAGLKGPFMQYTHSGTCWGLKEKASDSLADSPKYQGVLAWLESLH